MTTPTPEAIPEGHPDSDPILRAACWAVMRERGYSDETILATETLTHKAAGCEWEMNTYSWLCEDENGDSAHPVMDELDELDATLHAALEVVQPFIAAQAKAEALRDAAEAMPEWPLIGLGGECDGNDHHRAWLRAHADHIEGKSE